MLVGICLALLLTEGVLQVVAAFTGAKPSDLPSWFGVKRRMLCLGDSNTFGLYVDASQTYPKVFETLWNAEPGNGPLEVSSLGFPGLNSSQLARDFRRLLWAFRPDTVTVMIGANDPWTIPQPVPVVGYVNRLAMMLWERSWLYRLAYLTRHAFDTQRLEVIMTTSGGAEPTSGTARYGAYEFELGSTALPEGRVPTWRPAAELRRNLTTMAMHAKQFGANLILITYPADDGLYQFANRVLQEAAKTNDTRLIELTSTLKRSCPEENCSDLFVNHHPNVAGHRRMAEILLQEMKRQRSR
ncbi:MAG TPA: GDSL-type esterase/lipase family protein [Candidatus Acidoferrales bacterium]|nr:GDSL-type esterase/lipase family protein [Candidatus Acidoferrales bacterium]